jgi:SAM-dependent methyltransferase
MSDEKSWTDYYDEQGEREPRELLLAALASFEDPGDATDLGCGQGIDTVAMLDRGWRVFAVDAEPEGIRRLKARLTAERAARCTVEIARMEDVELPPADLLHAGFSLFFCPPERFADVWAKIRASIRPGGRFVGEILGDRDTWAADPERSAFPEPVARALFDGLEIERFEEEENDGEACSGPKRWHVFHVVAFRASPTAD